MKRKSKVILSPFLPNKEALKQASLKSLRTSFEIEGIYFTDEEFQEIINKVVKETASAHS